MRHPGANLTIWAESSAVRRFGADRAGECGRTLEAIGQFVARTFLADVDHGASCPTCGWFAQFGAPVSDG